MMSAFKRTQLKNKQQVNSILGKSAKLERQVRSNAVATSKRRHSHQLSSSHSQSLQSFSLEDDCSLQMEGGRNLLNSVATK